MNDRKYINALVVRLQAATQEDRPGLEYVLGAAADVIEELQAQLDDYELAALDAAYAGTLNHPGIRADYEAKRREVTGDT